MAKPNANALAADIAAPVAPVSTLGPSPAPVEGSNLPITSFEGFRDRARHYGATKAVGDDGMAMFAIELCQGGKDGKIDPRTETERKAAKLADTTDQIETLFADYVEAKGAKAIHERTGTANQVSKLRNFVLLGALKTINGVAVLDEVKSLFNTNVVSLKDRKGYRSALEAYNECAKKQIASPTKAIDETVIAGCFIKPPGKTPSSAKVWEKISKLATSLTDGSMKAPDGTVIEDKTDAAVALAARIAVYATDAMEEAKITEAKLAAETLQMERAARQAARDEAA